MREGSIGNRQSLDVGDLEIGICEITENPIAEYQDSL